MAGLQWIWQHSEAHARVFALLEQTINGGKKATGRPGLTLWQILVLGVVRLGLDCDYDRLEHLANYDGLLRPILGLEPVRPAHERPFHHKTLGCEFAPQMGRGAAIPSLELGCRFMLVVAGVIEEFVPPSRLPFGARTVVLLLSLGFWAAWFLSAGRRR